MMGALRLENGAALRLEGGASLQGGGFVDQNEYFPSAGVSTMAVQGKLGYGDDPNISSYALNKTATRKIGGTTWQVCGFRDLNRKLVVGKRALPSGAWTLYQYDGAAQFDCGTFDSDSHNVVAVEIDADGYVHVTYNHHSYSGHLYSLKYRRSGLPLRTWNGGLTNIVPMLGANESSVTYPLFFRDPVTDALNFMFRDGVSGAGDWYHYLWNDATRVWAAAPGSGTGGKLISGNAGTVANPYLNGLPKFSSDWDGAGAGWMHMNWMWRSATGGIAYNSNIMHAKWNGSAWFTYAGASQTVPITIANADIVHAVGPGVDLFNQVDFDLDANNRPVVAVIHGTGGNSQLYALYHNGSSWVKQAVTAYTGSGTLEFGRPCVVIDRATNICTMIGTHTDRGANVILQWVSGAGDFSSWTESTFYTYTGVALYEPTYDHHLWRKHQILQMLISAAPASVANGDILQLVV